MVSKIKENFEKTGKSKFSKENNQKNYSTLELKTNRDIAFDFAQKVYQKFDALIKSIILFGSVAKEQITVGSDIDIIIVIDDATFKFDERFIMWYREELGNLVKTNPYKKDLHINTIKITTWWEDLQKGEPTLINIIRYGEALIDVGGFFSPLKFLLQNGRIKPTPESILAVLNRVPGHIMRSRINEMSSIEGCYWAFVESSQALLMAIKILPPSQEHIPELLEEHFVNKKLLDKKYVKDFSEISQLHKQIIHGAIKNIDGRIIDDYQEKSEDFFKNVVKLLNEILDEKITS